VTKIAYAASMGDEAIDEHAQRMLSKLLENFDFISVREQSLLELIKPLTNVKPVKVLDPVFLLSETEWRKIIRKNGKKKKYLLFYQLLPSTEAMDLAKKIGRERQLEIVHVRGVKRAANPFGFGNLKLATGPFDFISLIAHAEYVVSTSYHGIVFSIVFRKQFSALGFKGNFYRIKSLLSSLGIEERFIDKISGNYTDTIDYAPVNIKLKKLVQNSLSFITGSIKKAD
jgi:polysaccharide pyruvyl transferase WcaK-like protein